jgi:GYF domain 2
MPNQWYCNCGGRTQGPLGDAELRQLAADGKLKPADLVWKEGMRVWEPASKLRGLFAPRPAATPAVSVSRPPGRCWYCRRPRVVPSSQCPYCHALWR